MSTDLLLGEDESDSEKSSVPSENRGTNERSGIKSAGSLMRQITTKNNNISVTGDNRSLLRQSSGGPPPQLPPLVSRHKLFFKRLSFGSGGSSSSSVSNHHSNSSGIRGGSQRIRRYDLLARDNLDIPIRSKSGRYFREMIDTRQPLIDENVEGHSDDSEDYEGPLLSSAMASNHELKNQLIKDGYNLDQQSDIDDLDLIPPRSFERPRFLCCRCPSGCVTM